MKVILDLSRLLHDRQITQQEHDRLLRLAERETGALASNLLVAFGVIAVAGGALALLPSAVTAMVLGALLMGAGLVVGRRWIAWRLLANIILLVGALTFAGGFLLEAEGSAESLLLVAAIFAGAAVMAESGLLTMLSVAALVAACGAGTGYVHAAYEIEITRPLLTIGVCGALAFATLVGSTRFGANGNRLCLIASRTALVFMNMGFWIGSLWGDPLQGFTKSSPLAEPVLSASTFAVAWALVLAGVAAWAMRANRPWVLNAAAVFSAIHFYTQWFEHLHASPRSMLAAGLVTIAAALVLRKLNGRFDRPPGGPPSPEAA